MHKRYTFSAIAILWLAATLILGACGASDDTVASEQPVTVDAIEGSDLARVTLVESSAARLDIQTVPVTAVEGGYMVPSSAVLIDPQGLYWVYTNPEPLVYERWEIRPVYEESLQAFFSDGPPVGMPVVIVGVPELYGAETGIGK